MSKAAVLALTSLASDENNLNCESLPSIPDKSQKPSEYTKHGNENDSTNSLSQGELSAVNDANADFTSLKEKDLFESPFLVTDQGPSNTYLNGHNDCEIRHVGDSCLSDAFNGKACSVLSHEEPEADRCNLQRLTTSSAFDDSVSHLPPVSPDEADLPSIKTDDRSSHDRKKVFKSNEGLPDIKNTTSIAVTSGMCHPNDTEPSPLKGKENRLTSIETNGYQKPPTLIFNAPEFKATEISKVSNKTLELSGLKFGANILQPPSVKSSQNRGNVPKHVGSISVEKSSKVLIGPEIEAPGDVTINQFVDVDLGNAYTQGLPFNSQVNVKDSSESESWCNKLRYLWATLFVGAFITAAVTGTSLVFLDDSPEAQDACPDPGGDAPANYTSRVVSRSQWSQHADAKLDELPQKPARYAVVCHTAGNFCDSPVLCINIIRGAESWNIQIGYTAIGYNFLIAGDGYIYEGRGWNKFGAHTKGFNCNSVGIGFVGNFDRDPLLPSMVEAFDILMAEGVRRGALPNDYKVVGANQINNIVSPGTNIRNVIKTWPHWAPITKNDTYCV